jgi:hypothetical protein
VKPKLTNDDFCRAAKKLRCDVAAIKAVAEVESKGKAFYDDGFPVILFERHKFRKFTGGQFSDKYPEISGPAGNYGAAGQHQRDKFNLAFKLDPAAAMKSCSWGMFQIMGFNHEVCGYKTVDAFVDAMKESEAKQLDAFVNFLISEHLDDELRDHKWTPLAEGYNGEGYRQNNYHIKLPAAHRKYAKENIDCSQVSAVTPSANAADDTAQADMKMAAGVAAPSPPIVPTTGPAPESLVAMQTPVIEVESVSAEPEKPKDDPAKPDVLTRIGNKAVAFWTAAGTTVVAIGTFLTSTPIGIAIAIIGAVAVMGLAWMLINWRRNESKEKRDQAERLAKDKFEAELKAAREQRAFELQKMTLESAMRRDLNTVRIVPPPTTIPNSDPEPNQ